MRKIIFLTLIVVLSYALLNALPDFAIEGYIYENTLMASNLDLEPKPYLPSNNKTISALLILNSGQNIEVISRVYPLIDTGEDTSKSYYQIPYPLLEQDESISHVVLWYDGQIEKLDPYTITARVDFNMVKETTNDPFK